MGAGGHATRAQTLRAAGPGGRSARQARVRRARAHLGPPTPPGCAIDVVMPSDDVIEQSGHSHVAHVEPGQTAPDGQHIAVPPMQRSGWQKADALPGHLVSALAAS